MLSHRNRAGEHTFRANNVCTVPRYTGYAGDVGPTGYTCYAGDISPMSELKYHLQGKILEWILFVLFLRFPHFSNHNNFCGR